MFVQATCLVSQAGSHVLRFQPVDSARIVSIRSHASCRRDLEDAHRNLEVDEFLRKCTHFIVEAELVFANLVCGEDKVSLPLLLAVHDILAVRSSNLIIDIEGTAGLHLATHSKHKAGRGHTWRHCQVECTYCKVKSDLLALGLGRSVEARLFVRLNFVRQCRGRHTSGQTGQEAEGY